MNFRTLIYREGLLINMNEKNNLNWRSSNIEETIKKLKKNYKKFGITRVANVTGLDHIGIPIYSAIRPNSKTIVSSAGKGLNNDQSLISAVMEAIETEVAENLDKKFVKFCAWRDLNKKQRIPLHLIPKKNGSIFKEETLISWTLCKSVGNSKKVFLPSSLIAMSPDYCYEQFMVTLMGSNGLASGLSFNDAFLSGLYELIERDAIKCWGYGIKFRKLMKAYIREETIPYKTSQNLLRKISDAGMSVYISEITTDINIPVFKCQIGGDIDNAVSFCEGYGCHHNPEIALNRALTEAVQARTIIIAGSRDDFTEKIISKSKHIFKKFAEESKKVMREDFNQFSQFNQKNKLFFDSSNAIKDILKIFSKLKIDNLYYFEFENSKPFKVVKLNCLDLVTYIPGNTNSSFVSHSRYKSFIPRIFGIRKVIFDLNN